MSRGALWRLVWLWGPVVGMMAVIFSVSSLEDVSLPGRMTDVSGHGLGYATLGLTLVRALAGGLPRRITLRMALGAIAIAVAYGATDEVHQMFVHGRTAELRDLYADATGATVATVACWAWGILAARPRDGAGDRNDL